MKKTQLLDIRRNIRKEIVAFLSIVMIGLLAALAYLGIAYSASALKNDAVAFFNARNFWDAEIISTMLMTEEDLAAIEEVPGVREAEPVWQVDTRLRINDTSTAVAVVSLPEQISLPVVLEGRLPEAPVECAVERKLAEDCGLAVGQELLLSCDRILDADPLLEDRFVITGIFNTPDHFTYMVPVTPYIYVTKDAFNREGLDGAFMRARIRVDDAPEYRYSDEYWNHIRPVTDALKALGDERAPERVEQVRSSLEDAIREGQEKVEQAREDLRKAREKIDQGNRDLADAEEQLGDMKKLLDDGEVALVDAQNQLEIGEAQLEELGKTLDQIGSLAGQHNNFPADLSWWKSPEAKASWPLKEFSAEEFGTALYLSGGDVDGTMSTLSEIVGYNAGQQKLQDARRQYEEQRNNWYYMGEQYLDGLTSYQKGKKELEEGERELAEGEAKLRDAENELADARKKLEEIGDCSWVVLNDNGNPGFVYGSNNADKLASLSMSFSTIFLVVGALVIYATISRMVEEQRKLIGVNKALGMYSREIFVKYLVFAWSAVLLGVGLGVLLAWLPMQRAVLSSYEVHLNYGRGTRSFLPLNTGIVVAGAFAISTIAVYLGCSQLLRRTALSLMQGEAPTSGKQKQAGSSAKRSLYPRLILRNMMTDRKRVLVTIISIAGGCVLMVVGFALRYGISGVPDRQFGGIMTYDAEVYFDTAENPDAQSEIDGILNQSGLQHIPVYRERGMFEVDEAISAMTVVVAEKGSLNGYFALEDVQHRGELELSDNGALVPRRFWEHYGVGAGDSVVVYDSGMARRELPVDGVFENYYGQLFFLSPAAYEKTFGTEAAPNCFYVKTGEMPLKDLQKKLEGVNGFVRVDDATAERTMIEQFTSSLNFVVYMMLFIAGVMACFIVANFTVTYIQRKTSELTIMRINGFTANECIRYVALDLVVTTVLGTLLGLVLGGLMGSRILGVTETPYIQMVRDPRPESFIFAALITIGFSAITNYFALRRIRRLKLTDV